MTQSSSVEFGRVRSIFWPVHRHEQKKLLPMLLMAFFISFGYNILRTAKDALVVTAKGSGAEAIPFIKVWVLLPMALFLTYLFAQLSNRLSREQVFYSLMSIFLAFFALFIFVLYPSRDILHPHQSADFLQNVLPQGFKGLIAIYRNWTFTAYYVMAELWGNIILSLLFWGFANDVTNVNEAGRFYGLLCIALNCAGIFSGQVSVFLSSPVYNPQLPFGSDAWEQSLILLISTVLLSGIAAIFLFKWMHNNLEIKEGQANAQKKKNFKMSLKEMFSYLANSRYLTCLAIIVVSYNLTMNLVEVLWKGELKQLYPNPNDYNIHMSKVSIAMGLIATFVSLFISGQSIRRFGWAFTAAITPVFLLIASAGFFGFLFMKTFAYDTAYALLGTSPLIFVCIFGSAHNAICRGSKYSVFDTTKEMAFIPLSYEAKVKGKAVIDGVGSRLGKSGGSLVHQVLLMTFSSLTASAPYVAFIVLAATGGWLLATQILGKQFTSLHESQEACKTQKTEEGVLTA